MFIRELPVQVKNGMILAGILVGLTLAWLLAGIIAPVLVSLVLAYILNPIVRFLEARRLPRPWAVLTLYIIGFLLGIVILIPFVLQILSEGSDLAGRLSVINVDQLTLEYKNQLRDFYLQHSQIPWLQPYLEMSFSSEKVQDLAARAVVLLKDLSLQVARKVFGFVFSAFSGVASLMLLPLLTFYILVDLDLVYQRGLMLVPPIYRPSVDRIGRDIDTILSAFLRGQILSCLIFGSLMTLALSICDLRFAVLLGPFAGLANLVPYLGGAVTVVLAAAIAVSQVGLGAPWIFLMIKVAIALAVVQGIDGFLIQPKVIGENVGLHPVIVILALIIGGSLFGFLGMLLSVPATCILKVLSAELYAELYEPHHLPA